MFKLVLFGACFVLSALGTWGARCYALRRNMLDHPGERRSHVLPTPRGGGVGIVLVMLLVMCALGIQTPLFWLAVALGLALVALVGWCDDHRPLSAGLRLAVHICSGGILAGAIWLHNGSFWLMMAAFVAVPVLVNVWNFIDGINGLAVSQAVLAALAFAFVMQGSGQWLALAVAAAGLGFLPFNFPRARIFLGDVGSGGLGYLMAVLLVLALPVHVPSRWEIFLLPISAMLADSGLTLLRRMWRAEPWWQPHITHLYQQLARRHGHARVTFFYAVWSIMACLVMFFAFHLNVTMAWLVVAAYAAATFTAWKQLQHG